ncbi:MAG: nuclease-related domain-containing protein [Candidatus Methylomirabilales bacterium]
MAKIMKQPGTYLQQESSRSLLMNLLWVLLGGFLAIAVHPLLGLFLIPWAVTASRRYTRYKKGLAGEQEVSRTLMGLDDSYYIIHDASIPRANIDHIVLGPNGIFVLETKHFSGWVKCEGDRWWVAPGPDGPILAIPKSPSLQAKRNALKVRERIREFEQSLLKDFPRVQWVHAMVVLSHPQVEVVFQSPAVLIVKVSELVEMIKTTPSPVNLPAPSLTKIGLALLGMRGRGALEERQ